MCIIPASWSFELDRFAYPVSCKRVGSIFREKRKINKCDGMLFFFSKNDGNCSNTFWALLLVRFSFVIFAWRAQKLETPFQIRMRCTLNNAMQVAAYKENI